ncbi:MAG: hypothetical protein ACYC6Y_21355, partial [Thermoguttaceae bacterium]
MANESRFSTGGTAKAEHGGRETAAAWLLNAVDASLAGCIFVVPILLGGRSTPGHFALTLFAAVAASAWWLRQSLLPRQYWRRSAAHLLLAAAVVLVILQLVPLSADGLVRLSPRIGELLSLGHDGGPAGFGPWTQVSLCPAETRRALALLLACAAAFSVTVQRLRSLDDVERLLTWVAYAAIGMGLFGLIQYATGNGKFFWVYQDPFAMTDDGAKGAFTNRNHFAHFLALGLGPVIWWVQDGIRRLGTGHDALFDVRHMPNRAAALQLGLRFSGLALLFLALLMSMSR